MQWISKVCLHQDSLDLSSHPFRIGKRGFPWLERCDVWRSKDLASIFNVLIRKSHETDFIDNIQWSKYLYLFLLQRFVTFGWSFKENGCTSNPSSSGGISGWGCIVTFPDVDHSCCVVGFVIISKTHNRVFLFHKISTSRGSKEVWQHR